MAEIKNMDSIQMRLLEEVADLHQVPAGAYNIRANGQMAGRVNSANIEIISKDEGEQGIDIHIKAGTRAYPGGTQPKRPDGDGVQ